jgi:hypothetical protein
MNYSSRRTTHLLKLSMIAAMDHSDAEVIEATDVTCAQDWLIEARDLYARCVQGDVIGRRC